MAEKGAKDQRDSQSCVLLSAIDRAIILVRTVTYIQRRSVYGDPVHQVLISSPYALV